MTPVSRSRTDPSISSHWIDAEAPFELVKATVAIRNALDETWVGLPGNGWVAAGLLGLRARELGFDAEWRSVAYLEGFHILLSAGRWMFDPTAEQFGYPGPVVLEFPDWELFYDEPDPGPNSDVVGGVPDVPPLSESGVEELILNHFDLDEGRRLARAAGIPT